MRLSDHERATSTVTLSDEQFAKIVELLTPGYEVAKLYLADYHRHQLLRVKRRRRGPARRWRRDYLKFLPLGEWA